MSKKDNRTINDENFDRWLDSENDLSRVYHEGDKPGPSAQLDAKILAQASAATAGVSDNNREQRPKRPAWMVPIATAATLMVGVNLAVLVRDNTPDPTVEAPILMEEIATHDSILDTSGESAMGANVDEQLEAAKKAMLETTPSSQVTSTNQKLERAVRGDELLKATRQARSGNTADMLGAEKVTKFDDKSVHAMADQVEQTSPSMTNQAPSEPVEVKTNNLAAPDPLTSGAQYASPPEASAPLPRAPAASSSDSRYQLAKNNLRTGTRNEASARQSDTSTELAASVRTQRTAQATRRSKDEDEDEAITDSFATNRASDDATAAVVPAPEMEIAIATESPIDEEPAAEWDQVVVTGTRIAGIPSKDGRGTTDADLRATNGSETETVSSPVYVCVLEDFGITAEEIELTRYAAIIEAPPRNTLSWRAHIRDLVSEHDYRTACLELAAHEIMFPNTVFLDDFPVRLPPAETP